MLGVWKQEIILHQGDGGYSGGGTTPTISFVVNGAGFGFEWTYSDVMREHSIHMPWWLVAQLAALYPLWWLDRHILRPKRAAGLCARCGYDLRATPDRCPECGEVPHPLRDNS